MKVLSEFASNLDGCLYGRIAYANVNYESRLLMVGRKGSLFEHFFDHEEMHETVNGTQKLRERMQEVVIREAA